MKNSKLDESNNCIKYRTLTRLAVEELQVLSKKKENKKGENKWMDWALSVQSDLESLDEPMAEKIIMKLKEEYEAVMQKVQRMLRAGTVVASFPIGISASSGSCDEGISDYWQEFGGVTKEAQLNIEGNLWYYAVNRAKNYGNAFSYYQKAADLGDPDAMVNLGNCYFYGKGTTVDYGLALKYYTLAADKGHAIGQYNLGMCYQNGRGVVRDKGMAAFWYEKAAEQNMLDAQRRLADYYMEQSEGKKAVLWFEKAASQGDLDAQKSLGYCYRFGKGVPKNLQKAVEWYRKAADQNDVIAMNIIADFYHSGEGVPMDKLEAKKWYKKASDRMQNRS